MRHQPINQIEFLACLARVGRIKIIKRFRSKLQRGLWEGEDGDAPREITITIAWAAHRQDDFAHDMTKTLIHEVVHQLRHAASEKWTRKETGRLYIDDKIRAEAAIRLLNVTYFDGEGDE